MATNKNGLPRKAYAYAPTADPSTWKLPFLNADGSPDPEHLPAAAAAISEGGFRGQKADIPSDAMAMVKSKLRQAYRKWKGSDVEYPDSIRESEDDIDQPTFREAVFLLDRAAVEAKVLFTPDGDALVFPCYTGAFDPPVEAAPGDDDKYKAMSAGWDVESATRVLGDLYRMKASEMDDAAQAAQIDRAIEGVLAFIQSEGKEMTAAVSESGRRHAKKDESLLRQFHQLLKDLGVECEDPARETVTATAVVEAAAGATPEAITFRESSEEMGLVNLREAAPKFDDANQTVWITPIKPGWGNKRDKFFYREEALKEATQNGLFNNIKMFRDHPRKSDEKELPERSVKDWFATTREATWDEARGVPRVPIKVHDESDYRRFKDVPEQVAFSVLGGGLARPGKVNGEDGRIVESLKNVRSVDWVTEAGAGGAIDFAESAAQEHEDIKMEIETLSDEQIKAEAERRGMKFREADAAVAEPPAKTDDKVEPEAKTEPEPKAEPKAEPEAKVEAKVETPEVTATATTPATATEPVKESATPAEPVDFDKKVAEAVAAALAARDAQAEVKESAKKAVAAELAESDLPKRAKDLIVDTFREAAWGNGYGYTDEPALRTAVKGEIAKAATLLGLAPKTSKVTGLGDGEVTPTSVKESVADRMDRKFGPSGAPKPGEATISESGQAAAVSAGAAGVEERINQKYGRA